jgi:pSer/pThr/pTyr-binding forkhead associated (FHA) protein
MDTQAFRKFCPVCKLDNDADVTNCQHCGGPLSPSSAEDVSTRRVDDAFELTDEIREQVTRTYIPPSSSLSLFLLNMGEPIAVRTEDEFVLGRVDEATSEPIVDLTEFDGFATGVSRRHALIHAAGEKYMLTDLNSSNGTWLNGHRLVPTRWYVLPSGAVIQLGRMKLVVSYIDPPQKTK